MYLNCIKHHFCSNIISNTINNLWNRIIHNFKVDSSFLTPLLFARWHNIHLICIIGVKANESAIISCPTLSYKALDLVFSRSQLNSYKIIQRVYQSDYVPVIYLIFWKTYLLIVSKQILYLTIYSNMVIISVLWYLISQ